MAGGESGRAFVTSALARLGTIKAAAKRPAKAKPPSARESDIQAAIVAYLAAVCPTAFVWAVPNAARREPGGRAGNAVPGLRKGVYDLSVVFDDGRFAAIEVKTDSGVMSEEQLTFAIEMHKRGIRTCVARGLDDVRRFLTGLGVKTREAA